MAFYSENSPEAEFRAAAYTTLYALLLEQTSQLITAVRRVPHPDEYVQNSEMLGAILDLTEGLTDVLTTANDLAGVDQEKRLESLVSPRRIVDAERDCRLLQQCDSM